MPKYCHSMQGSICSQKSAGDQRAGGGKVTRAEKHGYLFTQLSLTSYPTILRPLDLGNSLCPMSEWILPYHCRLLFYLLFGDLCFHCGWNICIIFALVPAILCFLSSSPSRWILGWATSPSCCGYKWVRFGHHKMESECVTAMGRGSPLPIRMGILENLEACGGDAQ